MAEYCDVAVPVPLDQVFTYRLPEGVRPSAGGRVLVPFRQQRTIGIVTELHDRAPKVLAKNVLEALDENESPALREELLRLGKWISEYYLAPLGEVFRSMLPLSAEFRRAVVYRITDEGHMALHLAGSAGSSARSKRTPEDQDAEFRVLDYLASRDQTREESLRTAARVSRAVVEGMVRKRWIAREDVSQAADASRVMQVARRSSWCPKLGSHPRWRPMSMKYLETKLPSCTPASPTKNALSTGIAFGAGKREQSLEHARQSLLPSPTSRS